MPDFDSLYNSYLVRTINSQSADWFSTLVCL